ncbi:MAG TPA: quinate 5-dehydrogenase [Peptococcaceae bacterium]|nr:MAG: putative membrane protein [Moorella sp. 60_41]HBT47307.1 quinate 5-dehydrogenase [Peptococcaceae bacterium]
MLRVVSVSLGTPRRNYRYRLNLRGVPVLVERLGCGGDLEEAGRLLESLDGKADALGLGGANFFYQVGTYRVPCPEARRLKRRVKYTPLVDGSGWKEAVEPWAVAALQEEGIDLAGRTALVASILDRTWLAYALAAAGCRVLAGDPAFALKLPLTPPLPSFAVLARYTLPFLARIPLKYLYPLGSRQEAPGRGRAFLYRNAHILAGNWHFLHRHLPPTLKGKIVIAAGTTAEDRRLLRHLGAPYLVTTSPLWGETAPSANMLEAVLVALGAGGKDSYAALARELGWGPRVLKLN